MTAPEQLAKWRVEAETAWMSLDGVDMTYTNFEAGYLRAKQETGQAIKNARKQALEEAIDLFPQGFAMLATNQVREIIQELLK